MNLKVLAYKTYIRPILEYATEVYNPYLKTLIKRLEKPQRTFTKKILRYVKMRTLNILKDLNYAHLTP
jgi:hypothetical protein